MTIMIFIDDIDDYKVDDGDNDNVGDDNNNDNVGDNNDKVDDNVGDDIDNILLFHSTGTD